MADMDRKTWESEEKTTLKRGFETRMAGGGAGVFINIHS